THKHTNTHNAPTVVYIHIITLFKIHLLSAFLSLSVCLSLCICLCLSLFFSLSPSSLPPSPTHTHTHTHTQTHTQTYIWGLSWGGKCPEHCLRHPNIIPNRQLMCSVTSPCNTFTQHTACVCQVYVIYFTGTGA